MTVTEKKYDPETEAIHAGGVRLVYFFDFIWREQCKRWNAPDWRHQSITAADVQNYKDVAVALEALALQFAHDY